MPNMTETVTNQDGETQQVQTDYSQEDCNASALFYLLKSIEADGGMTPEGVTALNNAKAWTNAINPGRYDFSKDDPMVEGHSEEAQQEAQQTPPAPARVAVPIPGQEA